MGDWNLQLTTDNRQTNIHGKLKGDEEKTVNIRRKRTSFDGWLQVFYKEQGFFQNIDLH